MENKLIEKTINYTFTNRNLLNQALVKKENQILEFYGDSVLYFYVSKILANEFGVIGTYYNSKYDEAKLTEIRKNIIDNENLACRMEIMNLIDVVNLSTKEKGDLFEAILGAVAIDSSFDENKINQALYAMLDINKYLEEGFEIKTSHTKIVQEWWQEKYKELPPYSYSYNEKDKMYSCILGLKDDPSSGFCGYALSKKDAREICAKEFLNYIERENLQISIKDYCPEKDELSLNNAINVLKELAEKNFIEETIYEEQTEPLYDEFGNHVWTCKCHLKNSSITFTGSAFKKVEAKKIASYKLICYIMKY